MNTHGHHDVADSAGLPVLARAFARADKGWPRLGAFYLGNWIADVSQLYDPVAYANAERSLKEELESLTRAAAAAADDVIGAFFFEEDGGVPVGLEDVVRKSELGEFLGRAVTGLKAEVDAALRWFHEGRGDDLRREVENLLFVLGYFKFVHPLRAGDDPRMHFPAYEAVFRDRYTQYYPHEHLDRPPVLPPPGAGQPPKIRSELADRTRATGEPLDPDLYAYLREDIEVVAGRLTEVELDWATTAFRPDAPADDEDERWNLGLARFGYALHGVEDFFAHSNFIEFAALRLGPEYFKGRMSPFDEVAFARRLKRWQAPLPDDWEQLPDETHVVTGIFDVRDTLFSIAHLGEELFGLDVQDPFRDDPDQRPPDDVRQAWEAAERAAAEAVRAAKTAADELAEAIKAKSPAEVEAARRKARSAAEDAARKALTAGALARDAAWRQITRTLNDTLTFIKDPDEAVKDPNNRVLKFVREPYEEWKKQQPDMERPIPSDEVARAVVRAAPIFQGLDDAVGPEAAVDIRRRFIRAVVAFSKTVATVRGVVAVSQSLFTVIVTIWSLIYFQKKLINLLFRRLTVLLRRKYGRKVAEHLATKVILYLAKRKLKKLAKGPLKRLLRDRIAEAAGAESTEAIRNLILFLTREAIYERLGHNRVGHHSLMAKDHGGEFLYKPMKDCARLIHRHVVEAMTRHAEPATRADCVDWLELLERYLRHPAATGPVAQSVPAYVPTAVTHVAVAGDTLVSLAKRYAPTAIDPAACTWEAIADANYDTADLKPQERVDVLKQELKSDEREGFRLRPGAKVLIPDQRRTFATAAPADGAADTPWFVTVIREGWQAFTGEDAEGGQSIPRHEPPPPPLIPRDRAEQRAAAAAALQDKLEQAYQPADGG